LKILQFSCLIIVMMTSKGIAETVENLDIPVAADKRTSYRFEILSQSGYTDERGRRVIDVIEGYQVNLALSVDSESGRPVMGLLPEFNLKGSSELIPPGELTRLRSTDESGILEFGITAGKPGMDELSVSFGSNEAVVYFNVISLRIKDFPTSPTMEVGLNWNELMQAKLDVVDGELAVSYPELVRHQDGETVTVWGFMMPLNADLKQKHFLITSSPPHCFFHIPGGPSGVIEVFSDLGIEASWEPVVLQGRFTLVEDGETGVIYQLQDAELAAE